MSTATARYGITIPFDGVPLHAHREWFATLRRLLRESSYVAGRGDTRGVVYVDVNPEDRPGAIEVSGLYTVMGPTVKLHLVLSKNAELYRQLA